MLGLHRSSLEGVLLVENCPWITGRELTMSSLRWA
jgi:hypothetical protein